jgi:hypothetical protein
MSGRAEDCSGLAVPRPARAGLSPAPDRRHRERSALPGMRRRTPVLPPERVRSSWTWAPQWPSVMTPLRGEPVLGLSLRFTAAVGR